MARVVLTTPRRLCARAAHDDRRPTRSAPNADEKDAPRLPDERGNNSACFTVEAGEHHAPPAPEMNGRLDVTATLAPGLTTADRCDRCGAQAYIRVRLESGGELLFCAHHGRAHLPKLHDVAAEIQDETDRLHGAEV